MNSGAIIVSPKTLVVIWLPKAIAEILFGYC